MSASPQLEDGHVRIATELLLALALAGLTARQWPIVMIIARKTYGYQKKVDDIGLSQLSELTGIAKPHVSVAVRELAARRIITRKVGEFGHILGINKNHAQWLPAAKVKAAPPPPNIELEDNSEVTDSVTVTDTVTVTDSVIEGLPNRYEGGYQIGKAGVTDSVTTIDNPTKENHQKKESCAPQAERDLVDDLPAGKKQRRAMTGTTNLQDRFERFYAIYPKKKSRAAAEKVFAKLRPDEQLLAAMIAGVARAMKSEQWTDPKFIPYPATWLGRAGWLDEIQTEYTADELAVIRLFNEKLGARFGEVPEAPFVEQRAALIREFPTFSKRENFAAECFDWLSDTTVDVPPKVGFDWIISRAGFTKILATNNGKAA